MAGSSHQSERLGSLHALLLSGDPSAADGIVMELMPLLERSLCRSFRNATRDAVIDAVEDALIEYLAHPHRFDPGRGVPLHAYLRLAAARNLQNRLRSDVRRHVREQEYAAEIARRSKECVPHLAPGKRVAILPCDRFEIAAARAWLAGERRTEQLAKLLGASELVDSEQRRTVKRFKDRLLKRIERMRNQAHKKSHG
jgi:RNA polymerase sigma-70 factor, ECF subfamily